MKKEYERAELQIMFVCDDVVTTSGKPIKTAPPMSLDDEDI